MHDHGTGTNSDEPDQQGAEVRERLANEALQAAQARLIQNQTQLRLVVSEARRRQIRSADEAALPRMERELTDKEAVLQGMACQLTEKEAALQGMARQLTEKEAALEGMARQLTDKETVLQGMARQLTDKEAVLQAMARELPEKEAALQGMARQLTEKESIIAELQIAAKERLDLLEANARDRDRGPT